MYIQASSHGNTKARSSALPERTGHKSVMWQSSIGDVSSDSPIYARDKYPEIVHNSEEVSDPGEAMIHLSSD